MALFSRKAAVRENRIDTRGHWPIQVTLFELIEDYEHPPRDYPEVFIVVEGSLLHESDQGTQALRRGSVVFSHAGNRHAVKQPEKARIIRLRFLQEWFSGDFERILAEPDLFSLVFAHEWLEYPSETTLFTFSLDENQLAVVERDIDVLTAGMNGRKPPGVLAQVTLLKILLHLSRAFATFWRGQNRLELREEIQQALHWIDMTVFRGETLRLKDMEPAVGLSLDHMGREFKRVCGMTLVAYAQKRRIHHAAHRLLTSHDTAREIARRLAFTDASHFSRSFQKFYGVPPQVYRDKYVPQPAMTGAPALAHAPAAPKNDTGTAG